MYCPVKMVPEISLSVQFDIADEIKLPDYLVQFPVLFVRMEEINAESGYYPTPVLVLQPVESERIKLFPWKYIIGNRASWIPSFNQRWASWQTMA